MYRMYYTEHEAIEDEGKYWNRLVELNVTEQVVGFGQDLYSTKRMGKGTGTVSSWLGL